MDKYIFKKRKILSSDDCDHIIKLLDDSDLIENIRGYSYIDGNLESVEFSSLKNNLFDAVMEYIGKHPYLKFEYNDRCELVLNYSFMIKKFLAGDFYGCKLTSRPNEAEHMEEGPIGTEGEKRILAWMVYLNDIKHAGGTHFPQQQFTTRPRAGDLYIWPAGWTHSHYGIPAPKEKKYFANGWCSLK